MPIDPIALLALVLAAASLFIQYLTWTGDRPHLRVRLLAIRNAPVIPEGDGEGVDAAVWFAVIEVANLGRRPIKLIKSGYVAKSGPHDSPHTAGSQPLPAWLEPGNDFSFYWVGGLRALAQVNAGPNGPIDSVWVEDPDGVRHKAQVNQRKLAKWVDAAYNGGFSLPYDDPSLPEPRELLGSSR
jgi:hypothetical protein